MTDSSIPLRIARLEAELAKLKAQFTLVTGMQLQLLKITKAVAAKLDESRLAQDIDARVREITERKT